MNNWTKIGTTLVKSALWIAGGISLLVAFLVLAVVLSWQVERVRKISTDWITQILQSNLTEPISIKKMEGNLWSELRLVELNLADKATLDTIHVRYNLLDLALSPHQIHSIRVINPRIVLEESKKDSSLWISTLLKPDSLSLTVETSDSEPVLFDIHEIHVNNADISYIPVSENNTIRVNSLFLQLRAGVKSRGYYAYLNQFETKIHYPNFTEPIVLSLQATADSGQISLTQLILGTGNSVLKAQAEANMDSTFRDATLDIEIPILSYSDLKKIEDQSPIKENLQVQLGFEWHKNQFKALVSASSESLNNLSFSISGLYQKQLSISTVQLQISELNAGKLFNLPESVQIQRAQFIFDGWIPIQDYKSGSGSISLTANTISGYQAHLDEVVFKGNWKQNQIFGSIYAQSKASEIQSAFNIDSLFTSQKTAIELIPKNVNLTDFYSGISHKTSLNGEINLTASELKNSDKRTIQLNAVWDNCRLGPLQLRNGIQTVLLKNNVLTLFSQMKQDTSFVEVNAVTFPFDESPKTLIDIAARNMTASEIHLNQVPSTDISFDIHVEAEGYALESLTGIFSVGMYPSRIGKAYIDSLSAQIRIANELITVDTLFLNSDFAELWLSAQGSAATLKSEQNRLKSTLIVKDLTEISKALTGNVYDLKGVVQSNFYLQDDTIKGEISVDADNLFYENMKAEQLIATIKATYKDELSFHLDLSCLSPQFDQIQFKDISLTSTGRANPDSVFGDALFWVGLKKDKATELTLTYSISPKPDSFFVKGNLTEGYFQSVKRKFILEQPLAFHVSPTHINMDTLGIISPDGAWLKLWASKQADSSLAASLKANKLDLFAAYGMFMQPLDGVALFSGVINAEKKHQHLSIQTDVHITPFVFDFIRFDSVLVKTNLEQEEFSFAAKGYEKSRSVFSASALVPFRLGDPTRFTDDFFERPVWVDISVPNFSFHPYSSRIDSLGFGKIYGKLDWGLQVRGKAGNPQVASFLNADTLQIADVLIDSIRSEVIFEPEFQVLKGESRIFSLNRKVSDIRGYIPLHLDFKRGDVNLPDPNETFEVRVLINKFDINVINTFLGKSGITNLKGLLSIDAGLQGEINNPYFDGVIKLNNGNVDILSQGIVLRNIEIQSEFDQNAFHLNSLSMNSNSGDLTLTGDVFYDKMEIKNTNVKVKTRDFMVANSRNLKARLDSDITLSGNPLELTLTGYAGLKSADIFLENFGERSVEHVDLTEETDGEKLAKVITENLTIDINLELLRDVWVRNREYPELNVEISGKADVLKNKQEEVQLFGSFDTRRGYARVFSKRFNLDEGAFTFTGDPTNPKLDIQTSYQLRKPDDITIFYVVGGTASEPEFSFRSTPTMEKEDIVSYTMFGRPFAALMGWQQGIAGQTTTSGSISDMAIGVLIDRLESYATEKLGIDVIEIDNSSQATGSGTSIRAGKYINDKTFIAIVQQLGGTDPVSQVVLEYLLQKNLDLVLTQSSDQSSGVDLRWRYEY